jgi:hypothetical protein
LWNYRFGDKEKRELLIMGQRIYYPPITCFFFFSGSFVVQFQPLSPDLFDSFSNILKLTMGIAKNIEKGSIA